MAKHAPEAVERSIRILRRAEVIQRVGISRSAIYRRIAEGTFPKPVTIGEGKAVGWLSGEIEDFLARCIAQRDRKAA